MLQNLGIFINNTKNKTKFNINLNNFNNLKNNFDTIIVVDLENEFANELKENIIDEPKIYQYLLQDSIASSELFDFDKEKVISILKDINPEYFSYITIISDNYIYCNDLKQYFNYVYSHNMEFYSFTDSTENKYHYQLYLITISAKKMNSFINYLTENIENDRFYENLLDIFDEKICYLKVAYIDDNYQNNVFYNDKIYQYFVENNILPILNINKLIGIKNNLNDKIFTELPPDFDVEIYKGHSDLKDYSPEFLKNHFLNYGQFEVRNYSKNQTIYPQYIRKMLRDCNLLNIFDVPDDFNVYNYKKIHEDLKNRNDLNNNKLLLHWINYGFNENRKYN